MSDQDFRGQMPSWPTPQQVTPPLPSSRSDEGDTEEQWLFQFHEHLLLTVQAIHRLHQALSEKML